MKPLWAHQKECVRRAFTENNFALFFEQGTGKTRAVIEIIKLKFPPDSRVLIICPPIVITNWAKEWREAEGIGKIHCLIGSGEKRLKEFQNSQAKVFVTNYESLSMVPLFHAFKLWAPNVIVFDESHKLKSTSAKRSKLANDLANPWDKTRRQSLPRPAVYLLSGTPILNNPMDIFMQYLVMDGGESFGSNFYAFRAKYFRDRNAGMPRDRYFPKWELRSLEKDGFDANVDISEILSRTSMRVEKKDCMDLPPEVSVLLPVSMSPEQARLYNEMKQNYITYFNSAACVATLAITKALRLMQITSGFISTEEPGEIERVIIKLDTPKRIALRDLLEQICEDPKAKVLVWAVWRQNYSDIKGVCDDLKLKYVEVHGDVPVKKQMENVETFNSDPTIRVFIGHPQSGGIGINLVTAGFSIFYSRTFSLDHFLQARARNHRGGSLEAGHTKITHYDLVVEGTIDEAVVLALANKQVISDNILNLLED